MKILTITSLFPNSIQPELGVFIKHRVTALAKFSELRVVAPVPWLPRFWFGKRAYINKIPSKEIIDGVQVYHPRYFITPKIGRRYYGLFYYLSIRSFVKKLQREHSFEIIDSHWAYPDGYACVKLGKFLNCPVSVSLRGSDIHSYIDFPPRRIRITETLNNADIVIPVSSSMKPLIAQLGVDENKTSVIENAVDHDLFGHIEMAQAKKCLQLKTKKIILSVGRFEQPKRFDLLIKAFARLSKDTYSDYSLVLVGGGSLEENLKDISIVNKVSDRVVFAGPQPQDMLKNWYNAAEIVCLASDKEGCPNVLLESLACGTPIVASDVGGVSDIISNDKLGVVVPSNDIQSWETALKKACGAFWNRQVIEQSQADNSWDAVAAKIIKEFQQINPKSTRR